MKVAIHQPNFLPWLGYFSKIKQSDIFIFLDDAEYTKNSFINRNYIKLNHEKKWLTLPVCYSGNSKALINEIEIQNFNKEKTRILKTLQNTYSKTPFYKEIFQNLEEIFNTHEGTNLSKLNTTLIEWICNNCIEDVTFFKSSEYTINTTSNNRLIDLVLKVDGTIYIHGSGGCNYQEEKLYKNNNIELVHSKYVIQQYPQKGDEFISHLSIIDALFNVGFDGVKKLI